MKTAFAPIVTKNSNILILGTMPGERSLTLQQYYGHAGNHFWKIMFNILKIDFSKDYILRQKLLNDNNIALWDVLENCEGKGSSDNNIEKEKAILKSSIKITLLLRKFILPVLKRRNSMINMLGNQII